MLDWLTEPLASPFMRNALGAGLLAALTCALVGTWVVLRGQTFLGDAVAHGVLPGVGVAFALGVSTTLGALVGAVGMALVVVALGRGARLHDDVAIGVTFAAMLAVGVLIVGRAGNTGGELTGFLFGAIAGVTRTDLAVQAAFAALVSAALWALHRPLTALAFDPDTAEVLGLRPAATHLAQLVLVAVAVVVSFQVVGALLAFALMTAPPATAVLIVRRIPGVMALAALFGGLAVAAGLVISWHADTAIGATIAVVATFEFVSVAVVRAATRRLARAGGRGARALSRPAALAVLLAVTACGSPSTSGAGRSGSLQVVTTSELFADLVRRVGADAIEVHTLIPPGSDPHSYEPPPSAARFVAAADLVVSNGLLLETRALTDLIEANLKRGARHLVLAEAAAAAGARPRELVEEVPLEVPWLGVEADADPRHFDPAVIELRLREVQGPGHFSAYVAGTLGEPEIYFRTDDGIGDDDRLAVPLGAHTHLNWVFDAPGRWQVELAAVHVDRAAAATELARATFRFAVGVPPEPDARAAAVDDGHLDLTFRARRAGPGAAPEGRLLLVHEERGDLEPADTTVVVPDAARDEVPDDPRYAFLGTAGSPLWVLPQAVAGKHTHGRLDPHLWLDPDYARRYVQLITDALVELDPDRAEAYRRRGAAAAADLQRLDERIRAVLAAIPADRRKIISTHDAFGYLAAAYDFEVSGFVAPTPGQEPSAAAVERLERAIRALPVPVVFQEPNYRRQNDLLARIAARNDAEVCTLYGETFDRRIRSYEALMLHNAAELRRCLGTDHSSPTPQRTREEP